METMGGKAAVALSGARMIRRVVAGEEETLVISEKRGDGGRVRSTLSP